MKKLILKEEQAAVLGFKKYPYSPQQVICLKKFLDNNFAFDLSSSIGADNSEVITPIFYRLSKLNGNPIQQMEFDMVCDMLDSSFPKLLSDREHKKRLIRRVVTDWYNKTPGLEAGSLSVNYV